jgi:hypothetical protein
MTLSIEINNIEFTCYEKYISDDRIYVLLTSKLQNAQPEQFVIYKSNSQGLWRFFTCEVSKSKFAFAGSKCPDKWDDYTVTTVIDFRLQNYVNLILDKLSLFEKNTNNTENKSYYKSELDTTNSIKMKAFMDNRHVFVPEFEVIYKFFKEIDNEVTVTVLENKYTKGYTESEQELFIYAKKVMAEIMQEMYKDKKILDRYQVLKLVSEFIKSSFKLITNPEQSFKFDKELFKFDNACIKNCNVNYNPGTMVYIFGSENNTQPTTVLYPYADDVFIYKINIQHNTTKHNYTLYYMKYKIMSDTAIYYMPVLITPINTKINKYGLPEKYVRTGIYCNKPWDYLKQSFFKHTIKKAKQIFRAADNYVFIGQNYKTIWPFNLPIITGLPDTIVSTVSKQNNYKIEQPLSIPLTIKFIKY